MRASFRSPYQWPGRFFIIIIIIKTEYIVFHKDYIHEFRIYYRETLIGREPTSSWATSPYAYACGCVLAYADKRLLYLIPTPTQHPTDPPRDIQYRIPYIIYIIPVEQLAPSATVPQERMASLPYYSRMLALRLTSVSTVSSLQCGDWVKPPLDGKTF